MVGTQSLRSENSIILLEHEEDGNTVRAKQTYAHKHEFWDLAPSPNDAQLLFGVFNDTSGMPTRT